MDTDLGRPRRRRPLHQVGRRPGSDWYRHATLHNSGRIRAGGIETDVALQPVEDPALVAQITEAYRAKYADQPSLVAMFLGPSGTEATLRVDQS